MKQHRKQPRSARSRLGAVVFALVVVLPSCGVAQSAQFEADTTLLNTRIYIYQRPTWDVAELASICHVIGGQKMEQWSKCTLELMRNNIEAPMIAQRELDFALDDGEWSDFGNAVVDAYLGGVYTDGSGRYTSRCLLADRGAFRDTDWRTVPDEDGHCKRGQHV